MKFIKTVAVLLAVSVSLMVPSFAWDSDSFVGQDFYFYEPVINYAAQSPSLMADSGTQISVSGSDFLSLLSFQSQTVAASFKGLLLNPSYPGQTGFPDTSFFPFFDNGSSDTYRSFRSNVSYDFSSSYSSIDEIFNPIISGSPTDSFVFYFDISSFGEFTTFELDGLSRIYFYYYDGSKAYPTYSYSVSLYVNGSLVHTFYSDGSPLTLYDFSSFVYTSSVPITSIYFSFSPGSIGIEDSFPVSGSISPLYWWVSGSVPPSFTVLIDDGALSGQYGQTQDDINQIDGIESQWGNSMTENFNSLSLDTFTYPDGLTSGFSLISGIFQDLWNAMGSYSILYVLPLTLAVVLLLIGRISKFAGQGRSSPSKEE